MLGTALVLSKDTPFPQRTCRTASAIGRESLEGERTLTQHEVVERVKRLAAQAGCGRGRYAPAKQAQRY